MRTDRPAHEWVYRVALGALILCVVMGVVGPVTATTSTVDGPVGGDITDEFTINYAEDRAGVISPPYTQDFIIKSQPDYFEFGPDASNRVRIRNTDTGESVTLSPEPGEPTYSVREFDFNANSVLEYDQPQVGIRRAPGADGDDSVSANVSVTGDINMFSEHTFAPYQVQVIDESGTVLAETGTEVRGVGYPEPDLMYNGSAIAVERHPDVDEDWYVEASQGVDLGDEMTNDAGADYFVVSVADTDFNETEDFSVYIYSSESSDLDEMIVALDPIELDDEDYVDGPVGGGDGDSPLTGPAAEYDANSDGEIDIGELGAAAQDFAGDAIDIGELSAVAQAYAST